MDKPEMLYDKRAKPQPVGRYQAEDFEIPDGRTALCPAGVLLHGSGTRYQQNRGTQVLQYKARDEDCARCDRRHRCLKNPEVGRGRQVSRFGRALVDEHDASKRMHRAIDSPRGRRLYSRRIATVEPVFANIRHQKGMRRFTLGGQAKVSTQWQLYCMWCTTSSSSGGTCGAGSRRRCRRRRAGTATR